MSAALAFLRRHDVRLSLIFLLLIWAGAMLWFLAVGAVVLWQAIPLVSPPLRWRFLTSPVVLNLATALCFQIARLIVDRLCLWHLVAGVAGPPKGGEA